MPLIQEQTLALGERKLYEPPLEHRCVLLALFKSENLEHNKHYAKANATRATDQNKPLIVVY
jgi:hypothetical protein